MKTHDVRGRALSEQRESDMGNACSAVKHTSSGLSGKVLNSAESGKGIFALEVMTILRYLVALTRYCNRLDNVTGPIIGDKLERLRRNNGVNSSLCVCMSVYV